MNPIMDAALAAADTATLPMASCSRNHGAQSANSFDGLFTCRNSPASLTPVNRSMSGVFCFLNHMCFCLL